MNSSGSNLISAYHTRQEYLDNIILTIPIVLTI